MDIKTATLSTLIYMLPTIYVVGMLIMCRFFQTCGNGKKPAGVH